MKRILFCAGLLAFMASCTQDDYEQQAISNEAQTPGISFEGQFAQAPATRGEVFWSGQALDYRWYAEQDQINVYGKDVVKGGDLGTGVNGTNIPAWSTYGTGSPTVVPAIYKATRSMNDPWFAGASNNDILYFGSSSEASPSEFLAVYPKATTLDFGTADKLLIKNLPALSNQTQATGTDGSSVAKNTLMVAYGTGYSNTDAPYESVGEKVRLLFDRPLGYLTWGTANLDKDPELESVGESLQGYFGNLNTIKLEAKGYDSNNDGDLDDTDDIAASILDYGNATMQVNLPKANEDEDIDWYNELQFKNNDGTADAIWTGASANITNAKSEVTLTYNGGKWSDEYTAYMLVSPVDRKAFQDEKVKENLEATYTFANITLVAGENAPEGLIQGNGYPMPAGDFALNQNWGFTNTYNSFVLDVAKYPYLVTDKITDAALGLNDERVLIINDADFADFMTNQNKVKWNGEEYPATEFGVIITKKAIYDEANKVNQYSYLQKFTDLKKLVAIADTEIPANSFNRSLFDDLTEINFPAVTEIDAAAFTGFGKEGNNGLTNVYLKSYPFMDRDIAFSFLDDDKLAKLDMSAATVMNVGFPSQGFTLEGYSNLTEVTVGTVEVGPNSFDGCINLNTINGEGNFKLNTNGFAAFRGTALTTINLVQTAAIPAYAFQNCDDLVSVTSDGTTLTAVNEYAFQACEKLTSSATNSIKLDNVQTIGDYAFYGCKEWTDAKLENTTSIGKCAFKDCSQLFGAWYENNTRKVIKVGAETVGSGAFHMCTAIEHIQFLNATEVERGVLGGASKLIQIQFDQPFTCNVDADESTLLGGSQWSTTFGSNTKNVTLFVNPAQTGRTSTQLTIGDTDNTVITFKSILNIEN